MTTMMKALVKDSPAGQSIKKVPVPTPGPNELLVKVKAAALCGTDLHILEWNQWAQNAGINLPYIMGHEFCGEVVSVGTAVTTHKIGDKVAGETHIPCDRCYQCMNGMQHICNNLKLWGVHTDGCFAEFAVIPAVCARRIPVSIPEAHGAVMEPLGTALRAAHEMDLNGASLVVIGCGPIGLFAISSAAAFGASKIIAVDISEDRLAIATSVGASTVLNPLKKDIRDIVLRETDGFGTDAVIEASGNVGAMKQSLKYLRKGGRMALIGLPSKPLEMDLGPDVVFKEAKIIGIHGRKMFETWTQMENMLAAGKINIDPIITHTLPLERWQEGVDLAKSGKACKVVFVP
ncbi:MAG: L-threonine 3-dehydrogenase [Veillonellales bacterium]